MLSGIEIVLSERAARRYLDWTEHLVQSAVLSVVLLVVLTSAGLLHTPNSRSFTQSTLVRSAMPAAKGRVYFLLSYAAAYGACSLTSAVDETAVNSRPLKKTFRSTIDRSLLDTDSPVCGSLSGRSLADPLKSYETLRNVTAHHYSQLSFSHRHCLVLVFRQQRQCFPWQASFSF